MFLEKSKTLKNFIQYKKETSSYGLFSGNVKS